MILGLVAVAIAGGAASVALGGRRLGPFVGLAGLVVVALLAVNLPDDGSVTVGGVVLLTDEPVRRWILILGLGGVGLATAAILDPQAGAATRRVPAAVLLAIGPAAFAVAAADDFSSILAATAAGCVGALVTTEPDARSRAAAIFAHRAEPGSDAAPRRRVFRTDAVLRAGEYTVLAATGATPRLLVVRVTPQG
jgi:hypothetical protein